MLGWEFPPYFVGGVGTVCYELTKALTKKGVEVTYIMPKGTTELTKKSHVNLIIAQNIIPENLVHIHKVDSIIHPYTSSKDYQKILERHKNSIIKGKNANLYGDNLIDEMKNFAEKVARIVQEQRIDFDVIHAHDYLTFPAAVKLKEITGKPLVVHVHITQFNITGGEHADPTIYKIERDGMMKADKVIVVSNLIKNICMDKYFIPESKISIVYNAITSQTNTVADTSLRIEPDEKIVLYLGRVTLMKGPDYFVRAAKKVLEYYPRAKFILAGAGDMLPEVINIAADLGISDRFLFPGFVTREEGDILYKTADIFVMPSVSEPFGIVPLEAIKQGTPVIISKQSGISEVLKNCLKVDFWNVNDIANKIIAALTYKDMTNMLKEHGEIEISRFTWDKPAKQCIKIYNEVKKAW